MARVPGRSHLSRMAAIVAGVLLAAVLLHADGQPPKHASKLADSLQQAIDQPNGSDLRVIIRLKPGTTRTLVEKIEKAGKSVDAHHPLIHAVTATLSPAQVAALDADDTVLSVSPDAVLKTTATATM